MASVNKVILIGNLGRDPEVRYTPSGSAVATLRIATTRSWKSKESGEKVEETEWHSVVLYERLAEVAGEYLKKGRSVYVEGRLKTRKWQDKDGGERYTTEIVVSELQMLGDKPASEKPEQEQAPAAAGKPAGKKPAAKSAGKAKKEDAGDSMTPFPPLDDDIPF